MEVVTPVIARKEVKQTENPPLFLDPQRMEVTGKLLPGKLETARRIQRIIAHSWQKLKAKAALDGNTF